MRLRESVPLGEGNPAGVNTACHGGKTEVGSYGLFLEPKEKLLQNRPCR